MAADIDQLKKLVALAETHQAKLAKALIELEKNIATIMASAPLKDGRLFDLQWAIQARVVLRQAIEKDYLVAIDKIIREYKGVAANALSMLSEYTEFAKLDPAVIRQLQSLSFKGFEDIGQQYLDVISKEVYNNTLTGVSFAESVAVIKATIDTGLKKYASQGLHDSLMQFDATINTKMAIDAGAKTFKYQGPDDSATRPFCEKHVGKVYTKEEIEEIWNSDTWAGKISGNPFVVRGGYNCRHRFRGQF